MARYIDAERIERYLHRDEWETPDERWRPEGEFGRIVDAIPTADVAEVRHGKWLDDEDDVYWGNYIVKQHCSNCGYTPHYDRETELFDLTYYCPNCGAYMEGDKQ